MADMGLKAKIKRVKYRSYKGEIGRVAPNVIARENPPKGLIIHTDQGWHYQHKMYQNKLKTNGLIQSMSRKGNCLDNSMMENFFGLMKSELLYLQRWDTIDDFEAALDEYIKYYNNDRIKLRLDGKSPAQYRALQISNH